MPNRKIHVLVVEDSLTARELLIHILESDPAIRVTRAVADGETALAAMEEITPDLVTMDIHLPGMDGFEVTRRIMETHPVPIVIVSGSYDPADVAKTFRALEAGAVAAVEKPPGTSGKNGPELAQKLLNTVKAMAEVRVIRRWPRARRAAIESTRDAKDQPQTAGQIEIVAIGASTGGPPVLRTILAGLGKPFPVPILIVQHISAGFVKGLADWLSESTGIAVRIAHHGERALAGHAYIAPDGCQMGVGKNHVISCLPGEPENGLRPAASCLFRSVAHSFGSGAVGILLTGMGRDGADDLKLMRDRGAITIAQDKESSVVHGMPGEAIQLGAAKHVLSPEGIAGLLSILISKRPPGGAKHG